MSEPVILVEREESVATITLNRPQARNALGTELREGGVASEWQARGRDGDDIESRRRPVTERGRSQV